MPRGSVQADGAQDRSLSRPPRATGLLERCVICFASPRFLSIPMVVAVAVAATATSADTVRQGPAVALPFGDIIIPVPAPPTNADPMNPASPGDVVTQRYNNLRTGTTLHSGLDPSAVSVDSFGLVGKLDVDGVVLAQPLFVEGVEFPNKGRRPAVFIATSTNNVYAFDADTLEKLWQHQLGAPFSVDTFQPQLPPPPAPPQKFKSCKGNADTKDQCIDKCIGQLAVTEQEPRVATDGIQSTPVIDVAGSHIIVSYRTTDRKSDNLDVPEHGAQRIAALNLVDGEFAKGLDGRDLDRRVEDNLLWNEVHRNRASLLLDEGRVYVAFAGRCEIQLWKFWWPVVSGLDLRIRRCYVGLRGPLPQHAAGEWIRVARTDRRSHRRRRHLAGLDRPCSRRTRQPLFRYWKSVHGLSVDHASGRSARRKSPGQRRSASD
jgi:hypothetical protein